MFTPKLSLLISLGIALATKGYQITTPSDLESSGPPWTSTGPNAIVWQRVSTDPDLFAIVLVNEDRSVLPINNQLLATSVDRTLLSIAVSPTNGEVFPIGSGFRVNFVKSASDMNTIYAQSSQFRIVSGGQDVTNTSTSAPTMASTMSQAVPTGTNMAPRTTYVAPVQTETVTTTMGSPAKFSSIPDRLLLVLACGTSLTVSFLWGTFI